MEEVVIVAAARTAVGKFGGSLATVPAPELGATVIKALLARSGVSPEAINEVIIGQVLTAGSGQNPARQAAIKARAAEPRAGLCGRQGVRIRPEGDAPGHAGHQARRRDIIIAGGQENMSAAPHVLPNSRDGQRMGDWKMIDTMIVDGLWDVYNQYHMGVTAENVAKKFEISAARSRMSSQPPRSRRPRRPRRPGKFKDEIVPVEIAARKGTVVFDSDEFIKSGVTTESLAGLRPAFDKAGGVTAGNASGLNDGAAAVLMMSAARRRRSA